jgi:predicted  nucleic acid-binding Zn-ribbon protein
MMQIFDGYEQFIEAEYTSVEQFEQAKIKLEQTTRDLYKAMKREKGLRITAQRIASEAAGAREEVLDLRAQENELKYLIRETLKSPYSPLKAYFRYEMRNPGGRTN